VLVREFRTPSGFVLELPGGSSWGDEPPREVAVVELGEETGLSIAPERLRAHHVRPLAATFSAHRQHLFSVELTEAELAAVRAVTGPLGETGSTERTYPRVARFGDLLTGGEVDWTTLGALAEVLLAQPQGSADDGSPDRGSAGTGSADTGSGAADTAPAKARVPD
jgi:ADP-ribose pyrophosphatase YjhB (NUDIX family)